MKKLIILWATVLVATSIYTGAFIFQKSCEEWNSVQCTKDIEKSKLQYEKAHAKLLKAQDIVDTNRAIMNDYEARANDARKMLQKMGF